ncbi:M10 family metallopeptidase [Neotabrizicola sp. sgz301269]|uniref:M10 family metallopeptidase n=1 Tax=Neotabrizicola sp. sgz301269 TaxID=3276282 RepID=UPI00376FB27F
MAAAAPAALGDRFWQGIAAGSETSDATASTATTYTMQVGQSFYGAISTSTDRDWIAVQLVQGQTYDIRLLGQDQNFLTDPILRIYDSSSGLVGEADNGFTSFSDTHEADSRMTFTAGYTGTYFVAADAFSTETGRYLLSVTEYDPNGMVFTADEIAWQLTNNGAAYFAAEEAAHFNVAPGDTLSVNITALTASGQYLARQALLAWTNVTGILFEESSGAAAITFDDSDWEETAYAYTNISGGVITSASVMVSTGWLGAFGTSLASYSFETYVHEIGHALGLAHGGNYNGDATYGVGNYYLNDSLAWSIMSYMQAETDEFAGGGDWNTYTDAAFRYLVTPQIADIIAIQNLYGKYSGAFTGNTVWGFNSNTGVAALDSAVNAGALMAMTVYDNGGSDTLDFSITNQAQVISLIAESMSSVLGGRHNLAIARDVTIENAKGGSGSDTIYGNASANVIWGNSGADILYGGDGNDILLGGAGADALYGGAGARDRAQYSDAGAAILADLQSPGANLGFAAGDIYVGIEDINGSFHNDTLRGDGDSNVLWGDAGADLLQGRDGNDSLFGGSGNDVILGGAGADLMDGGEGTRDRVQYSDATAALRVDLLSPASNTGFAAGDIFTGIEDLYGSFHADSLLGNDGVNILWGDAGNDVLQGRGGSDSIYGGAGNDVLLGGQGLDYLDGGAGTRDRVQYTDSAAGLRVDLYTPGTNTGIAAGDTFSGIEDLYGSFNADTLLGDGGDNVIWGDAGNDLLYGRAGNDSIYGGSGDDILLGGAGADLLDGGAGVHDRVQYTESATGLRVDLMNATVNTGIAAGDTFAFIEDLYGSFHRDTLAGDNAANFIWGDGGDDLIDGRRGNDTLHGGGGADTLYFGVSWGDDVILDYENGIDRLDFRNLAGQGLHGVEGLGIAVEAEGTMITFAGQSLFVQGIAGIDTSNWVFA